MSDIRNIKETGGQVPVSEKMEYVIASLDQLERLTGIGKSMIFRM